MKNESHAVRQARRAFIQLVRSADGIVADDSKIMAQYRLSPSQFSALVTLSVKGALCQTELAKNMLKSDGNITMVVRNLANRGLVKRSRSAKDARYITVSLTPAGARLINNARGPVESNMLKIMAVLTGAEQKTLEKLCATLSQSLHERAALKQASSAT